MPIVPKNPADQIEFYNAHVPAWAGDPGAVGLTPAITGELGTKLAEAKAAYSAALALRQQSEAATLLYRERVRQLHDRGSTAIATIKAFAESTRDIEVYVQARIDPPRGRGPAKPLPGAPEITSAMVTAQGVLMLEWRAAAGDAVGPSSGNYFEVLRQRAGLGEQVFTLIGTTAGLSLRDDGIGPGANIYTVRSRRGTRSGPGSVAVTVSLPEGCEKVHENMAALRRAA